METANASRPTTHMYLNACRKNSAGEIVDSKELKVTGNLKLQARLWSHQLGQNWTVNTYNGTRLYTLPGDTYVNGFDDAN